MNIPSALFGAALAFALSSFLLQVVGANPASGPLVQLVYTIGLIRPDDAYAGQSPDFVAIVMGRFLLLLALLCLIVAGIIFAFSRTRNSI